MIKLAISHYLTQLTNDKQQLSNNLEIKNVPNTNETFTKLVPMVAAAEGTGNATYRFPSVKFCQFFGSTLGDVLNNIDTSRQTDMSYMFNNCRNLTSLDLSNLDTSSATTMRNMFSYCISLPTIDVSNFDTSNVTNMYEMFGHYGSSYGSSDTPSRFTSLPGIENLNTSKVTNMYCMFANCSGIKELDLSSWDMSNVTTTNCMFMCSGLKSIKLGTTTAKLTNVKSMFSSTSSLQLIDMRYMDLSGVTKANASGIFYQVHSNAYADPCKIIVKDETAKTLLLDLYPQHNIKTVEELEAE